MKMAFQLMVDAGLPPPNAKPDGELLYALSVKLVQTVWPDYS